MDADDITAVRQHLSLPPAHRLPPYLTILFVLHGFHPDGYQQFRLRMWKADSGKGLGTSRVPSVGKVGKSVYSSCSSPACVC